MRPSVAALVFAAFPAALIAQAPRQYSYDFQLDPGGSRESRIIHGTARVSGSRARFDTDEEKSESDRSYFLLADGGRTVIVVHPGRREYQVHDADEFARIVGTAMRAVGPVMKMTVRDVRLDTARLGAGSSVAGRATQRVQLRQRWTTSVRVLGFVKDDLSGSAVGEYWADPSLPLMRNPLLDIVSTSLFALAASDETFLQQTDDAKARLFRGSPLKADVRMTTSGSDGPGETRLRYEVTNIAFGPVSEADLDIPKGYRKSTERTLRM